MRLKIILIPITFLLLFPVLCYSQIDSSKENYSHAFQFYIIDEIIVAYKYNFSENSALRFIVNATGLFKDKDSDEIEYRENISDTLTFYEEYQTTYSNQLFELKCQYLYNIEVNNIITIFFGAGPFVNYQFNQDESSRESSSSNSQEIYKGYWRRNENIWSVGISALIGLECIVYENISLFTEYEGGISRGWQTNNFYASNASSNTQEYNIDIWTYELSGLRLGVSIYF